MTPPRIPFADRFWAKVDTSGECWTWTATKDRDGYGAINLPGSPSRKIKAHRAAWLLAFGDLPADKLVCHHCDNPSCVRVEHLFLGDPVDNTRDMIAKGRKAIIIRTHCPQGHAYADYEYRDKHGAKRCRACAREHAKRYQWSARERYWADIEKSREENRMKRRRLRAAQKTGT